MAPFEDNAPNIVGAVIPLVILGCIVLPLRIYARVSIHALGWDDWCMIVAAVPWAALSIVCIGGAFNGVGVHEAKLAPEQRVTAMMWFWLFEILWCMAVIPVKLSISLMLGRIAVAKRPYVIGLYIITALLTIIALLGLIYIVFRCTPVAYAWDTSILRGKCQPGDRLEHIYYLTTSLNIAIDWYCALLPVPLLWNLPLPLKDKLSVGFLLSLGVLASVAACIRQKYTVALAGSPDIVYSHGNLVIWGYAEVGISFITGSLSTLRPLFSSRSCRGIASRREQAPSVCSLPETGRSQRVIGTDMKRLSQTECASDEEDLVELRLSIGKAI